VTAISETKGQYNIKTSAKDSDSGLLRTAEEPFDHVIVAAPLQFSNIEIETDLFKHVPDEIPYVTLHVTLFTSPRTLNPAFFNLAPDAEVPSTILTTLPPNESPVDPEDGVGPAGFFSISTLRTVINPKTLEKENLYKIFSPRKVTTEFLSELLASPIPEVLSTINIDSGDAITWFYPHVWHSYPFEYPRVTFEEIELARWFYYTSGIESFISTMETSSLMGKNVARLIVDDYIRVLEEEEETLKDPPQAVLSEEKILHVEEL
jgi:prenylcysteine oxidase/farnesylcysteine lyase